MNINKSNSETKYTNIHIIRFLTIAGLVSRQGRSHSVTSSVVREVVRIVGSDRAFCHRDEVDPLSEVDDAERTIEAIAVLSPATLEERRKLTNQLGEGRTAVELVMMTGYLERSDDGAKRA